MKENPYILYVEDDIDDAFFMQRAFQKAKRPEKVHVVNSGSDAIALFSDPATALPKFILLDIKMPKMSGLEVLAWLRKTVGNGLPIFMLSSSSQERDLKDSQRFGANGYLLKPSNATQLEGLLKSLADHCNLGGSALESWLHFDGSRLLIQQRS